LYKKIVAENIKGLICGENMVMYNDRIVFAKRVRYSLYSHWCYAYVMIDYDTRHSEILKNLPKAYQNDDEDKIDEILLKGGIFVLLSSAKVDTKDILPHYYYREDIEQIIDLSKNNADCLPIRVHSGVRINGHFLVYFITSVILTMINNMLKSSRYSAISALKYMSGLFINILRDDTHIIQEPRKQASEIIKYFNLKLPDRIT
jgi:hypothetical protein